MCNNLILCNVTLIFLTHDYLTSCRENLNLNCTIEDKVRQQASDRE